MKGVIYVTLLKTEHCEVEHKFSVNRGVIDSHCGMAMTAWQCNISDTHMMI